MWYNAPQVFKFWHLFYNFSVQSSVCSCSIFFHILPSFLGAFEKLRKATISFVMSVRLSPSVRPHETSRLPLKGSSWDLMFEYLSKVQKIQVSLKLDKNSGYFTWHQYTYLIISRSVLLIMKYVSDKGCREYQKTHFRFNNFFPDDRASYVIMWKSIVQPDRPQMTIRRMRIACLGSSV